VEPVSQSSFLLRKQTIQFQDRSATKKHGPIRREHGFEPYQPMAPSEKHTCWRLDKKAGGLKLVFAVICLGNEVGNNRKQEEVERVRSGLLAAHPLSYCARRSAKLARTSLMHCLRATPSWLSDLSQSVRRCGRVGYRSPGYLRCDPGGHPSGNHSRASQRSEWESFLRRSGNGSRAAEELPECYHAVGGASGFK